MFGTESAPKRVLVLFALCVGCFVLSKTIFANANASALFGRSRLLSTDQRIQRGLKVYEASIQARNALITRLGGDVMKLDPFPDTRFDPLHRLYMLWDFLTPAFPCPHELVRIGVAGDGGKYVCGPERITEKPDCIVYSFGVEQQSSFEAEMLNRSPYCRVYAYDYSVQQIGPEVHDNPSLKRRSKFRAYRLDAVDLPASASNPETHTLDYILRENGHTRVDILKIDIEGGEFDLLKEVVRKANGYPLPFAQLCLEIHGWVYTFAEWLAWWEMLERAGLRAVSNELNYQDAKTRGSPEVIEYTFINIFMTEHPLMTDKY